MPVLSHVTQIFKNHLYISRPTVRPVEVSKRVCSRPLTYRVNTLGSRKCVAGDKPILTSPTFNP